jgi:hypothetical protein
MSDTKQKIKQFMKDQLDPIGGDYGLRALNTPLTEEQRKIASMGMAFNAALVQFVLEGIIPFEQQGHFMGHLADFAERIYRGEKVKLPYTTQTLAVDSEAGRLYAEAAIDELENGHKNYMKMKERQAARNAELEAEAAENGEETSLSADSVEQTRKPTLH